MRSLSTLLIVTIFSIQSAFSCTCVGTNFCVNIDEHFSDANDLIFLGTFIKSEEPIGSFVPMQYKVKEIFSGEIVTPSSPLYNGEEFINTDSTVWILAGHSAICMPDLIDQSAVMAIAYNHQNGVIEIPDFGYTNYICNVSYLPVSDDGFVSGRIFEDFQLDTIGLEEFRGIFHSNCAGTNSTSGVFSAEDFVVQPQPTIDHLNIFVPDSFTDWEITLYDMDGRSIRTIDAQTVDLTALDSGVYFMTFERDRHRFTKRIIKI